MPNAEKKLRELAKYALAKKGARQCSSWCNFDAIERPHIVLPGLTWGDFFEEETEAADDTEDSELLHFARIPVVAERLAVHRKRHPGIREPEWVPRDGHTMMEVPL